MYPSVAHARAALQTKNDETARAFEVGGVFATMQAYTRWPKAISDLSGGSSTHAPLVLLGLLKKPCDILQDKIKKYGEDRVGCVATDAIKNLTKSDMHDVFGIKAPSFDPYDHVQKMARDDKAQKFISKLIYIAVAECNPQSFKKMLIETKQKEILYRACLPAAAKYWDGFIVETMKVVGDNIETVKTMKGRNMLGKMLMEVRKTLQKTQKKEAKKAVCAKRALCP